MKKFLFTLAALMMMSSAFAENIIYIEDFELTEAQLGTNIEVAMKAHFDNYVSGFRVQFTSLPEGLTLTNFKAGSSMKNLPYINEDGDEETTNISLSKNMANMRCLCASQVQCYDENGEYLGVVHWAPGDYPEMVLAYFDVAANFAGGTLEWYTEPTSGGLAGLEDQCCPAGSHHDLQATISVPGGSEPTALTADITIGEPEGLFVPITVANVNDPEAEITVTVGGQTATMENGGVTLPAWNTDYEIVVTVTAKGEDYEGTVSKSATVNAGEQPVTACEIVWTAADGQVSVDVVSEDGAVEHLYMGREEVAIPYTTTYDIYEGYGPVHFSATAQVAGKAQGSDEADVYADPVQKQNFQGNITIGDPDENGVVAVGYDGTETGYTMTVTIDGQPATVTNGTVTVPEGNHNIEVTISAEGYNDLTDDKDVTYTAPVIYDETCLAPNSSYAITGTETATVTIINREEGATVTYTVFVDGVEVPELGGSFTGESFSFNVTGDGEYVIHAVATLQGKNDSPDGGVFFSISEGEEPTGINELVNGKTVAGVRYFNMAGQEMSEANGMTIVVTTYTDGTTSAVKVMK